MIRHHPRMERGRLGGFVVILSVGGVRGALGVGLGSGYMGWVGSEIEASNHYRSKTIWFLHGDDRSHNQSLRYAQFHLR